MKEYFYTIVTPDGVVQKAKALAENERELRQRLTSRSSVTLLSVERNYLYFPDINKLFQESIEKDDIINFTRQLHTLISAGVNLSDSINLMNVIMKKKSFLKALGFIYKAVTTGEKFSDGLLPYEKYFGIEYIALVKAGESSGTLDKILLDLYNLMNWEKTLKKKITAALRYPLIVICVAFGALIGMFKFVIPKFAKIFAESGQELPLVTQILININTFFQNYGVQFFIILGISIAALIYAYKKTPFKRTIDLMFITIPVFGLLYRQYLIARFTKIFALLYQRGVSILDALKIVREINANSIFIEDVDKICYYMERGISVSEAAKSTILFSGTVCQMARIGEQSSSLDKMMEKVADLTTDEINFVIDNIFAFIEPLFIVIMGGLILTLALGVLLPMWRMTNVMAQ
jgi:type IV pilus assembly protein PilC